MKVTIKEVHSVFSWSWHVPNDLNCESDSANVADDEDVCGICRASYNATCPGCKYPGDECPLVVGNCNHNFHVHCIYKWLDTSASKGLCPMCRQSFQLKKGLAINDSHIEKFIELRLRQRQNQVEELLAGNDEDAIAQFTSQQDQEGSAADNQGDVIMDQGLIVR